MIRTLHPIRHLSDLFSTVLFQYTLSSLCVTLLACIQLVL